MVSYGRGALPTARELGEHSQAGPARGRARPPPARRRCSSGISCCSWATTRRPGRTSSRGWPATTLPAQRPLALHYGVASGVRCLSYAALTLWGWAIPRRPCGGVRRPALAQALAHPYSLAFAHFYAAFLHYLLRDAAAVQGQADALLTLATAQVFPTLGVG